MTSELEQRKTLELITKETWPDEMVMIMPLGLYGHVIYPGFKGRKILDQSITQHGKCLGGITDPGGDVYYGYQESLIHGKDPYHRANARKVLALEYKIHLMPHPEYVQGVTRTLCEHLRDDKELDKATAGFKVKLNVETQHDDQILPMIVIYPMLGKENAQLVLDRVYNAFPNHERMGMNLTPRDNRRINNLVYWAQSGGDLKKKYRKFRPRNTQFSITGSHFLGKEHELKDPSKREMPWYKVIVDKMVSVFARTMQE